MDWIVCDKKIFVNCITNLVNMSQTDDDTVLSQASTQGFISDDATGSNNSMRSELDSVSSSQSPGGGGKYSKRRGHSRRRGGKYSKRRR